MSSLTMRRCKLRKSSRPCFVRARLSSRTVRSYKINFGFSRCRRPPVVKLFFRCLRNVPDSRRHRIHLAHQPQSQLPRQVVDGTDFFRRRAGNFGDSHRQFTGEQHRR